MTAALLAAMLLPALLLLVGWAEPPPGRSDQRDTAGSGGRRSPKPVLATLSRAWSRPLAFCQTLRRASVVQQARPGAAGAAPAAGARAASSPVHLPGGNQDARSCSA